MGARAHLAGRQPRLARASSSASRSLMGFRSGAGVLAWLAVAGILVLFTLALTWIAVIAGLSAKTVDGAGAFSYPLIFLPFISSAFVPTDTMPGPVRVVRREPAGDVDRQHDPRPVRRSSRSATTSGSPSPGASASSSSPTPSRWPSTTARSPDTPREARKEKTDEQLGDQAPRRQEGMEGHGGACRRSAARLPDRVRRDEAVPVEVRLRRRLGHRRGVEGRARSCSRPALLPATTPWTSPAATWRPSATSACGAPPRTWTRGGRR